MRLSTSTPLCPLPPPMFACLIHCVFRTATQIKTDANHTYCWLTGCKENHFYSLPFGQTEASIILLAQMSLQLAPKAFWRAELLSKFFCYSNSSKNITCPSGKLKTEFTSPIAKSTSPRLSDTTFFARRLISSNGVDCLIITCSSTMAGYMV